MSNAEWVIWAVTFESVGLALSVRMCARKGRTTPLEMVLTVFRQMKRRAPRCFTDETYTAFILFTIKEPHR